MDVANTDEAENRGPYRSFSSLRYFGAQGEDREISNVYLLWTGVFLWNGAVAARSASMLVLCACSEGRWMHPARTTAQTQAGRDLCKTEVLSGREHRKDIMAGGINLSGCMQSKGYTYVEGQQPPLTDGPAPHYSLAREKKDLLGSFPPALPTN